MYVDPHSELQCQKESPNNKDPYTLRTHVVEDIPRQIATACSIFFAQATASTASTASKHYSADMSEYLHALQCITLWAGGQILWHDININLWFET